MNTTSNILPAKQFTFATRLFGALVIALCLWTLHNIEYELHTLSIISFFLTILFTALAVSSLYMTRASKEYWEYRTWLSTEIISDKVYEHLITLWYLRNKQMFTFYGVSLN